MSLAESMTEDELGQFISLYKLLYGKDIMIDINGSDIAISPTGDIDVTGVVVGRRLSELRNLVIQICLTVLLTEYEDIYGVGALRLEDLIGLYNSTQVEEYIQLMKAVIIEKIIKIDIIESVSRIDSEVIGDTIYFTIEIITATGEVLQNIILNFGV